jgi:hypothetical protein
VGVRSSYRLSAFSVINQLRNYISDCIKVDPTLVNSKA